jgi:hypothetical protein
MGVSLSLPHCCCLSFVAAANEVKTNSLRSLPIRILGYFFTELFEEDAKDNKALVTDKCKEMEMYVPLVRVVSYPIL